MTPTTPTRRPGTQPVKIRLTEAGRDLIHVYAEKHQMSFSAAVEALALIGLGQPISDIAVPLVVSAVRLEMRRAHDVFIALLHASALEAGIANRLAGAALKTLRPGDYDSIKKAARVDALARLRGNELWRLKEEIQPDDPQTERPDEPLSEGDAGGA